MPSIDSSSPTPQPWSRVRTRAREGTAGRLKNPARSTCPRTSTLRISHFPDPQNRRYNRPRLPGREPRLQHSPQPLDDRGEPICTTAVDVDPARQRGANSAVIRARLLCPNCAHEFHSAPTTTTNEITFPQVRRGMPLVTIDDFHARGLPGLQADPFASTPRAPGCCLTIDQ